MKDDQIIYKHDLQWLSAHVHLQLCMTSIRFSRLQSSPNQSFYEILSAHFVDEWSGKLSWDPHFHSRHASPHDIIRQQQSNSRHGSRKNSLRRYRKTSQNITSKKIKGSRSPSVRYSPNPNQAKPQYYTSQPVSPVPRHNSKKNPIKKNMDRLLYKTNRTKHPTLSRNMSVRVLSHSVKPPPGLMKKSSVPLSYNSMERSLILSSDDDGKVSLANHNRKQPQINWDLWQLARLDPKSRHRQSLIYNNNIGLAQRANGWLISKRELRPPYRIKGRFFSNEKHGILSIYIRCSSVEYQCNNELPAFGISIFIGNEKLKIQTHKLGINHEIKQQMDIGTCLDNGYNFEIIDRGAMFAIACAVERTGKDGKGDNYPKKKNIQIPYPWDSNQWMFHVLFINSSSDWIIIDRLIVSEKK